MADHVVRPSQTTFMQGRNILDGVAILHETVHELHRKKLNGVILKFNFKKAYDKVFLKSRRLYSITIMSDTTNGIRKSGG